MHCKFCGFQIPAGSMRCPQCGNPLSGIAQAQDVKEVWEPRDPYFDKAGPDH